MDECAVFSPDDCLVVLDRDALVNAGCLDEYERVARDLKG